MSLVMFSRECPSAPCLSPDCQVCLFSGPSVPDVLVFLQWTWCQDLYWASVCNQCCALHPRLPNLPGRLCCVNQELSSRRVRLRVRLVSTHLPVWKDSVALLEGVYCPPQLTWSYPGWLLYQSWACRTSHGLCSHCDCFAFLAGQYPRAQRTPVSDCLSVQACLRLLWSPIPEGSCFSGPYFCLLPSVPGSPVQPFPQFKVSQRSVKSGSLGIQYAAPKTITHLFIKLVGCTKTGC